MPKNKHPNPIDLYWGHHGEQFHYGYLKDGEWTKLCHDSDFCCSYYYDLWCPHTGEDFETEDCDDCQSMLRDSYKVGMETGKYGLEMHNEE